jgi:hypothetical protein
MENLAFHFEFSKFTGVDENIFPHLLSGDFLDD